MKTELNIYQYIKNFNEPKEKKNPDEQGMHILMKHRTLEVIWNANGKI